MPISFCHWKVISVGIGTGLWLAPDRRSARETKAVNQPSALRACVVFVRLVVSGGRNSLAPASTSYPRHTDPGMTGKLQICNAPEISLTGNNVQASWNQVPGISACRRQFH